MNRSLHQVVKNCGNFSMKVLPGMISYGREEEQGRGHVNATRSPDSADGYATKEHDIQLGGFIQRRAAQLAVKEGSQFSSLTVEEKEKLALRIAKQHISEFGDIGPEFYKHWMRRVEAFSEYKRIPLPEKGDRESEYEYFRRLRQWTTQRDENWPELHKAVATHLVFSPDPKMWSELRSHGVCEREFLRESLSKTMKDFSDWRRDIHGQGHSIGWIAGSHVYADGADKHPHIHVIVLKRDEQGKEVDWSVSSLKGRKGREHEPDPLREVKSCFQKNVQKCFERHTSKSMENTFGKDSEGVQEKKDKSANGSCFKEQNIPIRLLGQRLHRAARSILPPGTRSYQSDLGALLRILRSARQRRFSLERDFQPSNQNEPGD